MELSGNRNNKGTWIGAIAVILCVIASLLFFISGESGVPQPTAPDPTETPTDVTQPSEPDATEPTDATEPSSPTEPSAPDATEPGRTETTVPTAAPTEPTETRPTVTEPPAPTEPTVPDATEPPEPSVPAPTEPQTPTEAPTEPTAPNLSPEPTVPEATEHTHSYAETVVAPTCTGDGYTIFTCSCGDTFSNYYVPPLGHEYGEWAVTKEPTTEATGERQRACGRCKHVETDFVAPLDKETGEKYESYIDPRITVIQKGSAMYYEYKDACVSLADGRSWGEAPSVYVEEDGSLRVMYFLQDGNKVEQTIPPLEDYYHVGVIYDSGKFALKKIGNYS